MSQYIITETFDNYEITKKVNMIGLPAKRQRLAEKLQAGDLITFYVPRKLTTNSSEPVRMLMGQAKIVGDFILSDEPVWASDSNEIYPFRWKISFMDNEKAVPIEDVLYDLSVIKRMTNVQYWGLAFRNGMTKITGEDWKLITGKMG